jgi:hypothetical protein
MNSSKNPTTHTERKIPLLESIADGTHCPISSDFHRNFLLGEGMMNLEGRISSISHVPIELKMEENGGEKNSEAERRGEGKGEMLRRKLFSMTFDLNFPPSSSMGGESENGGQGGVENGEGRGKSRGRRRRGEEPHKGEEEMKLKGFPVEKRVRPLF